MISRLRYWLAKPLLDAQEQAHDLDRVHQYRIGYEAGLNLGIAIGQLQGQQALLTQMSVYLEQRHSDDPPTQEDIDRATQSLKH